MFKTNANVSIGNSKLIVVVGHHHGTAHIPVAHRNLFKLLIEPLFSIAIQLLQSQLPMSNRG